MRNRTLTFAFMIATVAGLLPPSGFSKKKADAPPQIDPSTLVWPMPPDKPRVRFVEVWANNLQIEPIKKLTWADKLAGVTAKNVLEDFGKPAGIATDSKGRIYITSLSRSLLYIIDKEHKQLLRISGSGGVVFRTPVGVAVDDKDNVYVSDTQLHMVTKLNPQLQAVANFGSDDGMVAPAYMSIDDQRRRIYIADTRAQCVFVYDLDSLKLIKKVGKFGSK
jgi:hypothetical protein